MFLKAKANFYLHKCCEKIGQLSNLTDVEKVKDKLDSLSKKFTGNSLDQDIIFIDFSPNYSDLINKSSKLYLKLLELLIEKSASPELFYPEIMELLIDESARSQKLMHDKFKKNPLHYAILNNDMSVVKKIDDILNGSLKQWLNSGFPSLLQLTIQNGQWEFAEILIQYGADINYQNKKMVKTALIKCIEDNGVNVNSQVDFCLKHDANPGLQDIFFASAFHYAAEKGNDEVMQLLMQYEGAKNQIAERDIYGRNVMDIVFETKNMSSYLNIGNDLNVEHRSKKRIIIKQAVVLSKFTKYLKIKQMVQQKKLEEEWSDLGEEERNIRKEEIVDLGMCKVNIENGGCCNGFSFLFLYYKYRGLKEEFYRSLELIAEWDEEEFSLEMPLEKERLTGNYANLRHLFEHWIHDVSGFQSVAQNEQANHYEIVKKDEHSTLECFSPIGAELTSQEFYELIAVFSYFPNLLMRINANKHTTALYVEERNQLQYYDANLLYETPLFTPKKIANSVINTLFNWFSEENVPMLSDKDSSKIDFQSALENQNGIPINLYCFGFCEKKVSAIKVPGKVPEEIKHLSICSRMGWTLLHLAVIFNDKELLKEEMKNKSFFEFNQKDRSGKTPLVLALNWQRHELIPMIVQHPYFHLPYSSDLDELASKNGYNLSDWIP